MKENQDKIAKVVEAVKQPLNLTANEEVEINNKRDIEERKNLFLSGYKSLVDEFGMDIALNLESSFNNPLLKVVQLR